MAEPAIKPMTLDEFLRWDDGTETRYELIGGFPMAMAPPAEARRMLPVRLVSRIDAALAGRRPCNAQIEAGVIRPDRADTYFEADIAATCEGNEVGRQAIKDPFLIVEILSPSTERHDRRIKLPVYRQIATIEEILFTASTEFMANCIGDPARSGSPKSCEAPMRGSRWPRPASKSRSGIYTRASHSPTPRSDLALTPRDAGGDRGCRGCRRRGG